MNHANAEEWQWASCADAEGFCGVAIVRGQDTLSALFNAHRLGINHGGHILSFTIPQELLGKIPSSYRNTLLSQDRVKELNRLLYDEERLQS